ncbi:hypothetical protein [Gemmata massiliana]|nr:hypothetical protein [Gemmata massiliana]
MARRFVVTNDEPLFGDTAFQLRDRVLGIVANAYTAPKNLGRQP